MECITVAFIGNDADAADVLYAGLKTFPAAKVILLTNAEFEEKAKRIQVELQKFHTPTEIRRMPNKTFEQIFETLAEVRGDNDGKRIIVNTDTDGKTSCIMLSASFVNGVQAIGSMDGKVIAYPIMKFSYYTALSDRKLHIAKIVADAGRVESLEALSQKVGMSLPLAVYHVRGSKTKPGLEQLGVVETKREKGKLSVSITPLGKLIIAGYIDQANPEEKGKQNARGLKR